MFKTSAMTMTLGVMMALVTSAAQAQRPRLEPAQRDPFTAFAPPAPKVTKPIPVAIVPPAPVAAPLPTAPDLGLFYAGQMTTPSGERQVFAMQQDKLVTLKVGAVLDNGYVVQAIEPRIVRFRYPALNTTARLNLPDLPKFETR